MKHVFAVLETPSLNRSLKRYFNYSGKAHYHNQSFPPKLDKDAVPLTFAALAEWINSEMRVADLREAIGIIELYEESVQSVGGINPIHIHQEKGALAAMLLLAFPEIHWIFVSPYLTRLETESGDIAHRGFEELHTLKIVQDEKQKIILNLSRILEIHGTPFTSLFDPFGFRQNIRGQIPHVSEEADYIPYRKEFAVSIDEESDYSFFVGYTAYRFGYCTAQISSYQTMEYFNDYSGKPLDLSFEDMYANFPDKPRNVSLSNLQSRQGVSLSEDGKLTYLEEPDFKFLQNAECHIIVTADHDKASEGTRSSNEIYIKELKKNQEEYEKARRPEWNNANKRGWKVAKPFSGIFDFWKEARQFDNDQPIPAKTYKGKLDEMRDPKKKSQNSTAGHGAPGRLLKIAECLLERANRLAESPQTVADAITGATLALEAQEYLGHRTPTVSFHALSLKHKLEVTAECMFYGVGYNFKLEPRFEEINRDTESIANWLSAHGKDKPRLDAEIKIVNEIGLIYQERSLFDEEHQCQVKIRDLYRNLRFQIGKKPVRRRVENVLRWYANHLLKSFLHFIRIILIWWAIFFVIFFGLDFYHRLTEENTTPNISIILQQILNPPKAQKTSYGWQKYIEISQHSLLHAFNDATVTVFSLQPPRDMDEHKEHWLELLISLIGVVISYFHLGIFISFVYSLVVRKQ